MAALEFATSPALVWTNCPLLCPRLPLFCNLIFVGVFALFVVLVLSSSSLSSSSSSLSLSADIFFQWSVHRTKLSPRCTGPHDPFIGKHWKPIYWYCPWKWVSVPSHLVQRDRDQLATRTTHNVVAGCERPFTGRASRPGPPKGALRTLQYRTTFYTSFMELAIGPISFGPVEARGSCWILHLKGAGPLRFGYCYKGCKAYSRCACIQ